jgi:formate hydrogenlyase subunit 3/multisubunit Na+/H+ antiporter MnhD subunit
MDYIFYLLYSTRYLNGQNKVDKTPWLSALNLLMSITICWLLLILAIVDLYIFNNKPLYSSEIYCFIGLVVIYCVYYMRYIKNGRYKKIYENYKAKDKTTLKAQKLRLIFLLIIPVLGFFAVVLHWHKII